MTKWGEVPRKGAWRPSLTYRVAWGQRPRPKPGEVVEIPAPTDRPPIVGARVRLRLDRPFADPTYWRVRATFLGTNNPERDRAGHAVEPITWTLVV